MWRTVFVVAFVVASADALTLARCASPRMMVAPGGGARRPDSQGRTAKRKKQAAINRKKGAAPTAKPRGFGAAPAAGKAAGPTGTRLDDPAYEALYAWLGSNQKTDLSKVAVADFDGLRGVMATEPIAAGEEIVAIPAELAIDLGTGSADPLPAAMALLAKRAVDDADDAARAAYWEVLPPPDSADLCTPDFFSEKEMQMLQWPPLVVETRQRSAALRALMGARAPTGDTDGGSLSAAGGGMRELRWAAWLVLSRVLTVQGPDAMGHKLLIPFMDMFNHRAGTKHYLTGRTDGMLKLFAGEPVAAGQQIFILYGTEDTSNAEFVGHYGFVDPSAAAAAADRALVRAAPQMVPALGHSTVADDEALLAATPPPPYQEQLALKLRLALKRAAAREGLLGP